MVKLFLSNRAIVVLMLPFIVAAYLTLAYFSNHLSDNQTINLGYFGVLSITKELALALSFVLVFTNAFLINFTFNHHEFFERNIYISSLVYVVLMSSFHSFYVMDGLLIAHLFIILGLMQVMRLSQHEDARRIVFNTSFLFGCATLVHPPAILIFPFIFIMVWFIRPFVFRESMLIIVGFAVPLIYGALFLLWSNESIDLRLLKQTTNYENQQVEFLSLAVVFVLIITLGILGIQSKVSKSSIRYKKMVRQLWVLFIIGIIFGVGDFIYFQQIERFSFILIPLPFFLTYAFVHKTYGAITQILFYLLLIYSCVKFFI